MSTTKKQKAPKSLE